MRPRNFSEVVSAADRTPIFEVAAWKLEQARKSLAGKPASPRAKRRRVARKTK